MSASNRFHLFRLTPLAAVLALSGTAAQAADGFTFPGTLGGTNSAAYGVSADGSVVVGWAHTTGNAAFRAFRWTSGGMADLGTLGGTRSRAYGVSADGSVVVGWANTTNDAAWHAFRWTQGGGMVGLGTLGGTHSEAYGVSADGSVVVGGAHTTGNAAYRAFRWTQGTGMQSVEDWLRAAGVAVAADITYIAYATNADGSVVVGSLDNGTAFIARVAPVGSGLLTDADFQQSLANTAKGAAMALASGNLSIQGAHGRPLMRRVAAGQKTFWVAGDWGRDDHGARNGDAGLAEAGLGRNFGAVQANLSLGHTWAKQNLEVNGSSQTDGAYLMFAMTRTTEFQDRYETVRVPERKMVTWGVDIAKLDSWSWLEDQETGQARLPEIG